MAFVRPNLVAYSTTTTGTGTITLGTVLSGHLTLSQEGVNDADTLRYAISDGTEKEVGIATVGGSLTTLTRTVESSTNSDTAISLSGTATVYAATSSDDWDKLDAIEDLADVTDTANVTSAGALMDSELTGITHVKALDQSVVSGATPTFTTTNMSDATNKRFMTDAQETKLDSVASSADVSIGQHTIWVPANGLIPTTTNGAAKADLELATNDIMISTADFDTTTEEHAQIMVFMPKSWDAGTMILQPVWSHAATTVNFGVVWGFQARSYADGDALDQAFGTEVTSTDTGGTTNDVYIGPETAAMTASGTAVAEEPVIFQVSRVVANGSDNMAIDARLHGFKIHYTTDTGTDD